MEFLKKVILLDNAVNTHFFIKNLAAQKLNNFA
jgi:hypothetical protein